MLVATVLVLAALVYTYLGYPLLIGLLARLFPGRRAPPTADPSEAPRVTVCLPVFNGAAHLADKLATLLAQDYPPDRLEILVYCDGCTDGSEAIARALAAGAPAGGRIRVLAAADRLGKPSGLNRMAAEARGDLLLLTDVRQPLNPGAASALARALADPAVGCATGRLTLTGEAAAGAYWRYERWIRAQESRFRGVVGMTGAIAMLRRSDFVPLPANLILDDVWIPMRLALAGKRVVLTDDAEAFDTAFEDAREMRRKIRTLTGNYQLFAGMPALLFPFRNPLWFETVSHKLLRLIAPWLLVALPIVSVAAALGPPGAGRSLAATVVAGQLAFYAAAAAGPRAGRLARTFVVLNAAAVVGLWQYLTGRQRVTW